jgi:5'-deoxynucleotidase YfbR-like HD superfamily hydrolase
MNRDANGKFLKLNKLATKPIAIRVDLDTFEQWEKLTLAEKRKLIKKAVNACNNRHTPAHPTDCQQKFNDINETLETNNRENLALKAKIKELEKILQNLQYSNQILTETISRQDSLIDQLRHSNAQKQAFIAQWMRDHSLRL